MDYLNKLQFLLKNDLSFENFIDKVSELPNPNELDTVGLLDTFPDDYLLGVYLPLLIPILFPIIQAFFSELKQHFKRN